jgi:hypothetical protein
MTLEKDFQTLITRRFRWIFIHWNSASNNYHNLDDFLIHLNSTIQEMRNITFLLQNHKDLFDDFDRWYWEKREIMKTDANLKWLHDARTKVVHQKELVVNSKANIKLLNWEELELPEMNLNPLLSNDELIRLFLELGRTKFLVGLSKATWKPLLKIRRVWIDSDYKEIELLELLKYWYDFLSKVMCEYLLLIGIREFIIESINLDDLNEKQEFLFDISTWKYIKAEIRTLSRKSIPSEIFEEGRKVFWTIKKSNSWDPISDLIHYHIELNKTILLKQPELLPACLFLDDNLKIKAVKFFPFSNRAEKYSTVRELAKEIQKESNITAVLFINEVWLVKFEQYESHIENPSDKTAEMEALSVIFFSKNGDVRNNTIPINRKDWEVLFWDLEEESWNIQTEPDRTWILSPIAEVWWIKVMV